MASKKHLYQPETSFPELSYPSLRDEAPRSGKQWLKGKTLDDGAEGYWRIHDKLYDFTDFIERHPGGQNWLTMTKGTDITEAFESHHISTIPEKMITKFYIRDAVTKRHSPFTFEENGFYRTLKARIREELKKIPESAKNASKRWLDGLVLSLFVCSILACSATSIAANVVFTLLAGLTMAWTIVAAHNYIHQRDNWRMHMFNFGFTPSREMRITHALSHHLFPNTLLDFEISCYEPFFQWLPRTSKSLLSRYAPRVYAFVVYAFIFDYTAVLRYVCHSERFEWEDLVPFSLPLTMIVFGKSSLLTTIIIWFAIWHLASFFFIMIGLNAAHHHPDIFHDGDMPKSDRDWGLHQLEAVMDRVDINKSYFTVLTNFGEHGLHHLFPTLDHAILSSFHEVFAKTCEEFRTQLKMTTQFELIIGQFKQLARTDRNLKER